MDNEKEYVAHVIQGSDGEWQAPHYLEDHLRDVAALAGEFATLDDPDWAILAGRWHDLGKYREKFQGYIRIQSGYERENAHIENAKRRPHSTAGAIHAVQQYQQIEGYILAYLITGHHAGLPDWFGGKGSLNFRLKKGLDEYQEAICENIPNDILQSKPLIFPKVAKSPETIALWMRMLFSCLVDADFLDTERYMKPDQFKRRAHPISLDKLQTRFHTAMETLQKNSTSSPLGEIRNTILNECQAAADWQPGLFSLTVPTGGGKTLSSLAFALKHAQLHGKKRIIYAIPFTSIIEQNANVFREFLGDDAVLEHHSNLDVAPEKENSKSRLATQNWDAPLIVTTNVQLFESLHASRPSRCRKLHNIANSVIILDEAQQLPRDFHAPITQIMQQLTDHFGVTWVLCTALNTSKDPFGQLLLKGLSHVREIISPPLAEQFSNQLKRVEVHLPSKDDPVLSWVDLAKKLTTEASVLTIVNTRKQAKHLFDLLPDDGNKLHLSANMCAEHRSAIIKEIKARLNQRREGDTRPLRVISTQLIEAGVDVDFPEVYRAMAGLDSIAQSAGRCNREDLLNGLGQVTVFKPEQRAPAGFLKQGEETTMEMIAGNLLIDPLSPASFEKYFTLMNAKGDRDKHNILPDLKASASADAPLSIQFRTAAEKFRLIDDCSVSIVVPYLPSGKETSPIEGWIAQLEFDSSLKGVYKKLQRYTISVPERLANALAAKNCIEQRAGLWVLLNCYYDPLYGLKAPDSMIEIERCMM